MKKNQTSTTSFNPKTGEVTIINKEYPRSQHTLKAEIMDSNEKLLIVEEALSNYQQAYNIIMEYFNYIPETEKIIVDKRLKECNL